MEYVLSALSKLKSWCENHDQQETVDELDKRIIWIKREQNK